MADFCNQCADDLGVSRGNMKGLSTAIDTAAGLYVLVLCEDCGPIQVDHEGNCVSSDCFKRHAAVIARAQEEGE